MIKNISNINANVIKVLWNSKLSKHKLNNVRTYVAESAPASSTHLEPKWQLVAAACITRTPIICPELKPIEKDFKDLSKTIEVENSYKSDHELRLVEDKVRANLISMGDQSNVDLDEAAKQTGAEFEDASLNEYKTFKFGSKFTDADHSKNLSSLNRALDRSLVLTIKQKLGSQSHWVFPQTPWIPGETLRQSSERIVRDVCGAKVKVKFLGNSPCGFFKYKYPKEVRKQGFIGAKVFFFNGHVVAFDSEGLEKNDKFSDYLWLTHEELQSKLGKSYYQAVSQFLISDQ